LGERIAQARERAGLSQGQLAEKMDVSQQVIAAWERKAKAIRTDTLVNLSGILGTSADELLGMKPARRNGPSGRVRQVFDAVAALPRRQQEKIVEVVEAFVEKKSLASS
jgi:transcriptional regulator with XRE-family HTH domain